MLTEANLLAYLENDTSTTITTQIEASAELRQLAAKLEAESRELTALLFRQICPTSDELGDYHFGWLSTAEMHTLAQHLAICPHCSQELRQMRQFLGGFSAETIRT